MVFFNKLHEGENMNCYFCSKIIEGNVFVKGNNIFHHKCIKVKKMATLGYIYTCPICNGDGTINETYDAYPNGNRAKITEKSTRLIGCNFCDKIGYLKNEPKQQLQWVKGE